MYLQRKVAAVHSNLDEGYRLNERYVIMPTSLFRHTMKFTLILALLLPIMLESSAKLCRRYVPHPIVPTQMMKSKVCMS